MSRHILPEEHERRMNLYLIGFSDRAIAKECGVTSQSIYYWRNRNNLTPNYAVVELSTGRKYYER